MNRDQYKQELEKYAARVANFKWENKDCYSSWLAQTYYFVCHSTRLISLSASRFYKDKESLHQRFLKHSSEENMHEKLALNDLKHLGSDINLFPELAITKGFYQSQYYQIERVSPEAFLGYILALEGIAVYAGETAFKKATSAHGTKPTSFLKVHTNEDKEHIESAFKHILSLDDKTQKFVTENFRQSGELYCKILDQIEATYLAQNLLKAS